MINPNPEEYGKPFHYLLSPSTFLDLDSFVQLAMSGQWVMTNIIIACLPLLYGLIIQQIFMLIKKMNH